MLMGVGQIASNSTFLLASTRQMTVQQVIGEATGLRNELQGSGFPQGLQDQLHGRVTDWREVAGTAEYIPNILTASQQADLDATRKSLTDLIEALAQQGPQFKPSPTEIAATQRQLRIHRLFGPLNISDAWSKPDYDGGPIGVRRYKQTLLHPEPLPTASDRNVLLINAGGDCRGYNCINYGAYQTLKSAGYRVFGALNGPSSLTNPRPQIIELNDSLVRDLQHEAPLLLGTGNRRRDPFATIEGLAPGAPMAYFLQNISPFAGGILFTGGDGTGKMTQAIYNETIVKKVVYAGASMDADIPGAERSIGMASSLSFAAQQIRHIRTTAGSCNKLHVVQVMGGHSGRFPLEAAFHAGEKAVLVPEIGPIPLENIYRLLFETLLENRGAILVVGEKACYKPFYTDHEVSFSPQKGLANASNISQLSDVVVTEMNLIAKGMYPHLRIDARYTTLGHTQRQPTVLAAEDLSQGIDVGRRMALALIEGQEGIMVPMYAREPTRTLDTVFSAASYQISQALVLAAWKNQFGPHYPELLANLRT